LTGIAGLNEIQHAMKQKQWNVKRFPWIFYPSIVRDMHVLAVVFETTALEGTVGYLMIWNVLLCWLGFAATDSN
jgi:hypothetical protein